MATVLIAAVFIVVGQHGGRRALRRHRPAGPAAVDSQERGREHRCEFRLRALTEVFYGTGQASRTSDGMGVARGRVAAVAAARALVVALAACSENTGDRAPRRTRSPADRPAPSRPTPRTRRVRRRRSRAPKKGGTLAIIREIDYRAPGPAADVLVRRLMAVPQCSLRTLTTFKDDGNGQADPGRRPGRPTPARTSTATARVWEFTIKKGVKFEDGRDHRQGDRVRHRPLVRPRPRPAAPPTSRSGWPTAGEFDSVYKGHSRRTRRRCRRA